MKHYACPANGSIRHCETCKSLTHHRQEVITRARRTPVCPEHGEMVEVARR